MKNTTYARPTPPDMLPNGTPNITNFRTSRARQVNFDPADRNTEPVVHLRRRVPRKRTLLVAGTILVILGLLLFWQQTVIPWWTGIQDQWDYGSSRITQLDANVGHDGISHFIAEYNKGSIVIIEIPYANPNNAHIYTLAGMETDATKPVIRLVIARDVGENEYEHGRRQRQKNSEPKGLEPRRSC